MSRHTHARRRLRERIAGSTVQSVVRALHGTHGFATSPLPGIRTHWITLQGQRVKAVYDWKRKRLVTVMRVEKGANGSQQG